MNRYSAVLFAVAVLTFSGCSDHKEINDVAPVLAIGVDKVEDKFQVTLEIPLPLTKGEPIKKPFYLDTGMGRNIDEAIQNIQNRTSRVFRFSHQRVIIIQEKIAKKDIGEVLDFVNRNQESRLSSHIYITKNKVFDIMNAKTELDPITTESIREIGYMMGFTVTVKDFLSDLCSARRDPVAPIVALTNGKPAIQSFAVFRKEKMLFESTNSETRGILWLKRQGLKGKDVTLRTQQGNFISYRLTGQKFKIKMLNSGELPEFRIKVRGRGILREGKQFLNPNSTKTGNQIEREIEEQIKDDIESILKKNRLYRIDTYGFSDYAHTYSNLRWEKKWREEWGELLPDIKTNIEVDFVLEQIGKNMNSAGNKH